MATLTTSSGAALEWRRQPSGEGNPGRTDKLVSGARSKPHCPDSAERPASGRRGRRAGVADAERPPAITRRNDRPRRPAQTRRLPREHPVAPREEPALAQPRLKAAGSGRREGPARRSRCVARGPDFPHHCGPHVEFALAPWPDRPWELADTHLGGLWSRAWVGDCVPVIGVGGYGDGRRVRPSRVRRSGSLLPERWRSARRICENIRRRDAADRVRWRRRRFRASCWTGYGSPKHQRDRFENLGLDRAHATTGRRTAVTLNAMESPRGHTAGPGAVTP